MQRGLLPGLVVLSGKFVPTLRSATARTMHSVVEVGLPRGITTQKLRCTALESVITLRSATSAHSAHTCTASWRWVRRGTSPPSNTHNTWV